MHNVFQNISGGISQHWLEGVQHHTLGNHALERALALRLQVLAALLVYHAGQQVEQHVALCDGARVVGAATALPLAAAEEEMQAPFAAGGMDPRDWYYFGESVLERAWRGRGIGVAFFAGREARAAALGFRRTAFCAVERPADHPLRPHGYVPLDAFWGRRGYVRRPELRASFDWRDIGQETETPHPMVFWTRET